MNLLKNFKQSWDFFYRNKYGLLIGTSFLHFTMSVIGINLLFWSFRLILLFSNQENLTKDNFYLIFSNPLSSLFCAIYILLVAFLTFAEFFILINFINSRRESSAFSIKTALSKSFIKLKSLVGLQIFFFIIYFISMVPLENLGLSTAITERLRIPAFITGEILKTPTGALLYFILIFAVFYINYRLIFTFPRTILKEEPLSKSIKESWRITKKKMPQILIPIGIFEIIFMALGLIFMFIVVGFLGIFKPFFGFLLSRTILQTMFDAVFFSFSVLTKISIVIVLLNNIEPQRLKNIENRKEKRKRSSILAVFMILLLSGSIAINGIQIYYRKIDTKILKIAHRGDIQGGVENSLEALESAKKKGADYVEMDIQLTRDNNFVVMHDYNLQRLTGRNARVRDLDLREIQNLTIFENGFKSRIPTFEEYVKRAEELKIKLLVELKPSGDEPENFAEMFVKKFRKLGVERKFKTMSLDLNLMRKIEKIAPEIETGFVIPLQFGDFDNSKIDFYVIEDFSYRHDLALKAHRMHRKIFVWTLNTRSEISKYLQEPIDGIISDELEMINEIEKEDRSKESILKTFVRILKLKL
ncbi:glycerophosphodiester phosphodiesterase [Candidatus Saccharibacteria bacterium]|nr:glycerophosphodiester phosphodiesterase [Candidatus Saccharibacteria bacterium]